MKNSPLKRTSGLKRGGGLKRSPLKSKPRQKEKRPARFADPQLRCRVGGCPKGGHHQHHVVLEQHVKNEHADIWDPRNALSLCSDHHSAHHSANGPKVQTRDLRDENIHFAIELFGVARAFAYLSLRYDDACCDHRILRLES